MTLSQQRKNARLRPKICHVMKKFTETKERMDHSTYIPSKTSFSKLKLKFSSLINIYWLAVLVYCLLMIDSTSGSVGLREREKKILDEIIGPASNYDKRIRPYISGVNDTGPTVAYVNIMIRDIQTISDVKMEYAIQIIFREQWKDSRLAFDSVGGSVKYLTLTKTDMVWMPDLFFKNEKEGHFHKIILPNLYLRIYPDGGVLYSQRLSLTLSCPMNLKLFPLDRQQCQLVMASYSWTNTDLVLLWKDVDPVQITRNLYLPRFSLEKFTTDYCNSVTNTGEYSCLRLDLIFKREFSYYMIQYYIPCCMLVIVSWISFWLDENAITARVALGVTTLLTMSIQISNLNQSLPPVSYTKAIDVWTGVCLTFVFGALLEIALVNHSLRSDNERDKMKEKKEQEKQSEMEIEAAAPSDQVEKGTSTFAMKKNFYQTWLAKFPTRSKRIDVISRITFPLLFVFFNITYWSTYLE